MFEHSIKVPRHYKIAANILKKVSTEGGSVKSLLYDDKLRHFRTNVLFALITETIKHATDIDKIFESSGLLTNESRLDPWLAKVLTAELLFGKKILPGKSKPEQTILSYKEHFEKYIAEHEGELKTEDDKDTYKEYSTIVVRRPRYVRINTNLLTTSDAIRAFQDEGYHFIRCTSGSYNDYLSQIQSLTEYDFTQDYHVKTVFVFAPKTKLHEHELYWDNKIILQDKATAMAVHLLAPPPGSTVLDMCAAPGMKTTQVAAFMRNEGKIYAVERDEKRYQTLCDFVEKTGSKCVETLHKDSLEIKRGDYDDVEYILLDPSCSGSGMELCVHNYIEDTRLAKLTSLQEKFLKHAMNSFPKAKRIVYSTCSLFPEENERVITNIVKTSRAKWRVQDVKELLKGQWNNFGSGMYGSIGTRCMYAKPDSDFTIGFFLAVLDRDQKDLENKEKQQSSVIKEENVKKIKVKANEQAYLPNGNDNDVEPPIIKLNDKTVQYNQIGNEDVYTNRHKKKKKNTIILTDSEGYPMSFIDDVSKETLNESKKKKSKKKTQHEASENVHREESLNLTAMAENSVDLNTDETVKTKKRKKKKSKNKEIESLENDNNANLSQEADGQEEVPIKKRKRIAPEVETELLFEESNTVFDNTHNEFKKKKNKRKESLEPENEIKFDENTTKEPKKKKKKKREEQLIDF